MTDITLGKVVEVWIKLVPDDKVSKNTACGEYYPLLIEVEGVGKVYLTTEDVMKLVRKAND